MSAHHASHRHFPTTTPNTHTNTTSPNTTTAYRRQIHTAPPPLSPPVTTVPVNRQGAGQTWWEGSLPPPAAAHRHLLADYSSPAGLQTGLGLRGSLLTAKAVTQSGCPPAIACHHHCLLPVVTNSCLSPPLPLTATVSCLPHCQPLPTSTCLKPVTPHTVTRPPPLSQGCLTGRLGLSLLQLNNKAVATTAKAARPAEASASLAWSLSRCHAAAAAASLATPLPRLEPRRIGYCLSSPAQSPRLWAAMSARLACHCRHNNACLPATHNGPTASPSPSVVIVVTAGRQPVFSAHAHE